MNAQELIDTARTPVAADKGLQAMDESNPICNKRFARLGIPQTEEARRAYRELIVTTPGLCECISGAILYDGTIHQQKKDGTPFVKAITNELYGYLPRGNLTSLIQSGWVVRAGPTGNGQIYGKMMTKIEFYR